LTGSDAASFGDEEDEDESVLKAGSLQMRKENAKIWQLGRKAWKDLWVVLKDDGCLYYYSSRQKVTTTTNPCLEFLSASGFVACILSLTNVECEKRAFFVLVSDGRGAGQCEHGDVRHPKLRDSWQRRTRDDQ
jgi:hypothetical protein